MRRAQLGEKRTWLSRRGARAAVVGICALGPVVTAAGCILAEPAGDLPTLPVSRPVVVQDKVVPSTSAVLGVFPSELLIPVELSDPTLSFDYATFVDYNSVTGEGLVDIPRTNSYEEGKPKDRIRMLSINLSTPPDLDRCHVIEVVIALRLVSKSDPKNAHTPAEPPGGDLVTWIYSPGGDLRGCPTLDAGIEASLDGRGDADSAEGGTL